MAAILGGDEHLFSRSFETAVHFGISRSMKTPNDLKGLICLSSRGSVLTTSPDTIPNPHQDRTLAMFFHFP